MGGGRGFYGYLYICSILERLRRRRRRDGLKYNMVGRCMVGDF